MEKQCKERVDLLEALRDSRQEARQAQSNDTATSNLASDKSTASPRPPSHHSHETTTTGWLGGGTVKPVDYTSIARPATNLPTPRTGTDRPSLFSWQRSRSDISTLDQPATSASNTPLDPQPSTSNDRSSSPEKRVGMLRTLRTGTKEKASTKMLNSLRNKPPAAAKAATQAWSSSPQHKSSIGSLDAVNASTASLATADAKPTRDQQQYSPPLSRTASEAAMHNQSDRARHSIRTDEALSLRQQKGNVSSAQAASAALDDANLRIDRVSSNPTSPMAPSDSWQRASSSKSLQPPVNMPTYRQEYPSSANLQVGRTPNTAKSPRSARSAVSPRPSRAGDAYLRPSEQTSTRNSRSPSKTAPVPPVKRKAVNLAFTALNQSRSDEVPQSLTSGEESSGLETRAGRRVRKGTKAQPPTNLRSISPSSADHSESDASDPQAKPSEAWQQRVAHILKNLPQGIDEAAAKQIFNEIVIHGDEVHWDDVAGLDIAKSALKETVVYPFLRPDLFMGLREPARGMLLFGPPGTGKTMLARAVATESKSTFFAISASSLTSKYLGESEKLVRALFGLAKVLAPSIIFVDEIDSLLSSRGGGSEHEATRRIKTEFLIQWSDLAKAAAGRETTEKDKLQGDATRVLVLAATNLPWAIDEAARRRFVRRQYIPLPEDEVRKKQLATLLGHQKQALSNDELARLVQLTDGKLISWITSLPANTLQAILDQTSRH